MKAIKHRGGAVTPRQQRRRRGRHEQKTQVAGVDLFQEQLNSVLLDVVATNARTWFRPGPPFDHTDPPCAACARIARRAATPWGRLGTVLIWLGRRLGGAS